MDITVIIPMHEIDASYHSYIQKSITSLSKSTIKPKEVLLVGPQNVLTQLKEEVSKLDSENSYRLVVNESDTSYCSQVNLAVSEVKTDFFMVLEIDDDINHNYFEKVLEYSKFYDSDIFMSLIAHTNIRNELLFVSNATAWVAGQTEVKGFVDITAAQSNKNYDITGAIIRTEIFNSLEGFKPEIKITFNRELLLRMMYIKDAKVCVVPIFGYQHVSDRPNSLFNQYKEQKITSHEFDFWQNTADTEYIWERKFNRIIEYKMQI